jgi:hypothetical protein
MDDIILEGQCLCETSASITHNEVIDTMIVYPWKGIHYGKYPPEVFTRFNTANH